MTGRSTRQSTSLPSGSSIFSRFVDLDRDRVLVLPEVPVVHVLLADLERRDPHEIEERRIVERVGAASARVLSLPVSRKKPESG